MPFTSDPMTELLAALEAAGVRSTMDAAHVSLPGAWLTLDRLAPRFNVAGDGRMLCSLYLITADSGDTPRVLDALLDLLNTVMGVLTPDGEVTAVRVVLDPDPTPQPALRVPIHL